MTLAKDTHLFLSSFRISSFNNFDCSRSLCSLPETNKTNAKRAETFERRKICRSNHNISSLQSFLAKTSTRTQTTELHSTTEKPQASRQNVSSLDIISFLSWQLWCLVRTFLRSPSENLPARISLVSEKNSPPLASLAVEHSEPGNSHWRKPGKGQSASSRYNL